MKILVYDIAAEDGGGLIVLKNFYQEVLELSEQNIEWIFMTSQDVLAQTEHILVEKYEWIKKSWFHRLFFEKLVLPFILRRIKPDAVISLQNMAIKSFHGTQFVYLHQSLQYCPKQFSFLKNEERTLAIRQRIICNIYKQNLRKASHIFVQTQWIKDATVKWLNTSSENITVVPVECKGVPNEIGVYSGLDSNTFFYPARGEIYKNHRLIFKACRLLQDQYQNQYKIILTVEPKENKYIQKLMDDFSDLPIECVGQIEYEKIWNYYLNTILLFPSYLETCGLPLVEAKHIGAMILAADMPFAHEVLHDYKNVQYFQYDKPEQLAREMQKIITGETSYMKPKCQEMQKKQLSLVNHILRKLSLAYDDIKK